MTIQRILKASMLIALGSVISMDSCIWAANRDGIAYKLEPGDGPFRWVSKGGLYYIKLRDRDRGYHLYIERNGSGHIVTNSIAGASLMVREECGHLSSASDMLQATGPGLFLSLFGDSSPFVVDERYIALREKTGEDSWPPDTDLARIEASNTILRRYISDQTPASQGNAWNWKLYVTTESGDIVRWDITGKAAPFKIEAINKTRVEKDGTVIPLTKSVIRLDE
ncbi:MAG: hypothetical protein IPP19_08095 [Verrucomicrobia bacterium]|nr:hypothetical protein [Verrucomicrobiota bacterium]